MQTYSVKLKYTEEIEYFAFAEDEAKLLAQLTLMGEDIEGFEVISVKEMSHEDLEAEGLDPEVVEENREAFEKWASEQPKEQLN